jgi:DNA-binding NtrC family response regulator
VEDLPEHLWTQSTGQISPVSAMGVSEGESVDDTLKKGMPSSLGKMAFKTAKESWLATFEKDYIRNLLEKNGFNISSAAREAEIDRKYFRKLMKKYNIESK